MKTFSSSTNESRPEADRQQMHAAHRCWQNENALWHEELKLWQDEIKQTREDLAKVLAAIEAHAQALSKHGASLTLYGQEASQHEHALAEFELGSTGANLVELAQAHDGESKHHAHLREVHEELKRRHHTIVARCSLLLKAVPN